MPRKWLPSLKKEAVNQNELTNTFQLNNTPFSLKKLPEFTRFVEWPPTRNPKYVFFAGLLEIPFDR